MANVAFILTALKAFTAFWSLILLAVSAAFIAKWNSYWSDRRYSEASGFDSGNAVIAASIISLVWFSFVIAMSLVKPENIAISMMVETIGLGFLWILVLGSVAALSTGSSYFSSRLCPATWCKLGSAVIGLGWILWFLIFGILVFQVVYTMKHYGGSYATWRTPIAQLLTYGTSSRSTTGGTGVGATTYEQGTTTTTGGTTAPVSAVPTQQQQHHQPAATVGGEQHHQHQQQVPMQNIGGQQGVTTSAV